jgi:hypothetical protein
MNDSAKSSQAGDLILGTLQVTVNHNILVTFKDSLSLS